jgi:hypothetical protein
MKNKDLLIRIDYAISKGELALKNKKRSDMISDYVDQGYYAGFRSVGLSLISSIVGEGHTYYKEFERQVNNSYVYNIESGMHILESIKHEVENGWLTHIKALVTAEIFSDFLEMSKYLLDEKYKDPAAVMIGSVLEEHLRQLCAVNKVDTFTIKGSESVPKKADLINADLTKAGVYGVLEQKNVTAWLDLRNRAAHGKYQEYTTEQVQLMYQGVLDFVSRIK